MPGFLRLDSIGEDSTIRYSGGNKPMLPSYRTNRCFSQSDMASVKSLTRSPSQSYYDYSSQHMPAIPFNKAHSFSGDSQTHLGLFSRNILSSSFDSSHIVPTNLLHLMTTARSPTSNLFSSPSCLSANMENSILTTSRTWVDTTHEEKPTLSLNINPSNFCAADNMSVFTQPRWLSNGVVPFESKFAVSVNSMQDNTEVVDKDSINNTKVMESAKSSSIADNKTTSDSSIFNATDSENVAGKSEQSTDMLSPSCEQLSHTSSDNSLNGHVSCNSSAENCQSEAVSTVDDSRSQCTIKSICNLALILSSPRKNVKKGRPSSKKQKKRQREKHKHRSPPLPTKAACSSSQSKNEIEFSVSFEFESNPLNEQDNSSISSWASPSESLNTREKVSTPVKAPSKFCSVSHIFFRPNSFSEEVDDENDGSNESSEWSENEHKGICISPIKGCGFNFALNLDSIFKRQSIPSLRNVLGESTLEESGPHLTASDSLDNILCRSQSHSEDDSVEDSSIEFCASPTTSEFASCGFATGLSLDILFPKRSNTKSQHAENWPEAAGDLGDARFSCDNRFLHISQETDLKILNTVNAKWNENYPSVGFRSCQSVSEDEIKDPSIKVHFAAEPHLVTVHVVGSEERGGTWHHFALDRERFERRIMDLERIISPVLEAGHRDKVLQNIQRVQKEQ